eukprot:6347092-Prymnesium_polylepis.1
MTRHCAAVGAAAAAACQSVAAGECCRQRRDPAAIAAKRMRSSRAPLTARARWTSRSAAPSGRT